MKKIVEVTKGQKVPDCSVFMGIVIEDEVANPKDAPIKQIITKKTIFYYEMEESVYKEFCKLNKTMS